MAYQADEETPILENESFEPVPKRMSSRRKKQFAVGAALTVLGVVGLASVGSSSGQPHEGQMAMEEGPMAQQAPAGGGFDWQHFVPGGAAGGIGGGAGDWSKYVPSGAGGPGGPGGADAAGGMAGDWSKYVPSGAGGPGGPDAAGGGGAHMPGGQEGGGAAAQWGQWVPQGAMPQAAYAAGFAAGVNANREHPKFPKYGGPYGGPMYGGPYGGYQYGGEWGAPGGYDWQKWAEPPVAPQNNAAADPGFDWKKYVSKDPDWKKYVPKGTARDSIPDWHDNIPGTARQYIPGFDGK